MAKSYQGHKFILCIMDKGSSLIAVPKCQSNINCNSKVPYTRLFNY